MKTRMLLTALMMLSFLFSPYAYANEPDSVYIFAYGTSKNANKNGLHFAWSLDQKEWHAIGPEHAYVKSDYGAWGRNKRMVDPFLFRADNGKWHCVWALNETDGAFAHASSNDLIYWGPQSYPVVMEADNCLSPEIVYDARTNQYTVSWESGEAHKLYAVNTTDFKTYSATAPTNIQRTAQQVFVDGSLQKGTIHHVAWAELDALQNAEKLEKYKAILSGERVEISPRKFTDPVEVQFTLNPEQTKPISDMLIGAFFEDINYAADGGLYAELVQNRGFEYAPGDRGNDRNWNARTAWSVGDEGLTLSIDTVLPIHVNNPHYAVLDVQRTGRGLINEGFDGIVITEGDKYNFSVFARTHAAKGGKLTVRLIGANDEVYGEAQTKALTKDWRKLEVVITAKQTVANARLEVIPQTPGRVDLDMVSLFPQKTFKNRKNGLRPDLAQTIADLHPRFMRFPGGCVSHGDGLHNIYRWENTIGALEARKPQRNLWGYHQSAGLGYYEYFLFCEDIGAEPLPVVAAGVPCQNSSDGGAGQQGGIPMCEMDGYIQDVLHLIEWANGDPKTSEWAKKRAEAGHPKPFNLKYLGVGNEDLITDIFNERFTMIFEAVKAKYPEITVIGTVGPFNEGTDYVEGWKLANELNIPIVDEHYYQTPGWYLNNQDYYDRYDRASTKVYLGEYASHVPGRHNNIETALTEALHLIHCERNGDVVVMTSYAPMLAKEGHTQWNPDLIYFNNTEVKPTVGYYVQQLFGQHAGDTYIATQKQVKNGHDEGNKRLAMSVVKDSKTNDLIVKIVNILPVSAKLDVNLSNLAVENQTAARYTLQGTPGDKSAKPQASEVEVVDGAIASELPAYSFTVIRLKAKE